MKNKLYIYLKTNLTSLC